MFSKEKHKILYLTRHAKAIDRGAPGAPADDAGRKLTSEGKKDAHTMGKRLLSMQICPQLVVSSPAARAIQTARILCDELGIPKKEILRDERIYDASLNDLMKVIHDTNDRFGSIMISGHNPSFNELLWHLCKTNIENIPKGGVIGILFDCNHWKKVEPGGGILLFFDSPKNK